jgi:transcriptional regulator with XRE-family HTH domain
VSCVGDKQRFVMVERVSPGSEMNSETKTDGCAICKLVGRRLRTRRTELGLAVDRVAEKIDIAARKYEGCEAGDAQTPAMLLAKMASLFGVPVLWFFQGVVCRVEIGDDPTSDFEGPYVYPITTMEQRLHFLTESFRELDLEGQQYLLTIIGTLSQSKSNGMEY